MRTTIINEPADHGQHPKPRTGRRVQRTGLSLPIITALACASGLLQLPLAVAAVPDAVRAVVGVVAPQGQSGAHADLGGSLRQQLVTSLAGAHTEAVALESRDPGAIEAEAKARGCSYVLFTTFEQQHGGGGLRGLMQKVAPLAQVLPSLGALSAGGSGGGTGNLVSAVAQGAASASAASAQQQALAQMSGTQQSSIKTGDTVTLEYRLVVPGQSKPVKADKMQGKAKADGEDVLGPMLGQVAGSVASVTFHAATGAAAVADANSANPRQRNGSDASAAQAPPDSHASTGGFLGRLLGNKQVAAQSPPPPTSTPTSMDCNKMAATPGGFMSADACRQMLAAQQTYQDAAADPRTERPGDEQMTCKQIMAELKQQKYAAPDRDRLAAAQDAGTNLQNRIAQRQSEAAAQAARNQAELNTAIARDAAAAQGPGALFDTRTAYKVQQRQLAEMGNKGKQVAAEDTPLAANLIGSTADMSAQMSQQIDNNPRLARLMQLASARQCNEN